MQTHANRICRPPCMSSRTLTRMLTRHPCTGSCLSLSLTLSSFQRSVVSCHLLRAPMLSSPLPPAGPDEVRFPLLPPPPPPPAVSLSNSRRCLRFFQRFVRFARPWGSGGGNQERGKEVGRFVQLASLSTGGSGEGKATMRKANQGCGGRWAALRDVPWSQFVLVRVSTC